MNRSGVVAQLRLARISCTAWLLAFGFACGDGPTEPIVAGPPASLEIREGQDQTGVVGAELPTPLRIRVVDANGNPVKGQIVNFVVVAGGGSVFAGAAITSDSGTAVERWTLGASTADTQRVEARAIDPNTGAKLVFGIFRATPVAGPAASVTKILGDNQTAAAGSALADSLSVRVTDHFGNPVAGASIAWSAASGTLSAATTPTAATGIARVRWTLGTAAGTAQATAAVTGLTAVTFSATAVAGQATQIAIQTAAAGSVIGAPFTTPPVVRILDALGNAVPSPSYTVTLSVNGGASVIGAPTATSSGGVASFPTAGLTGPAGPFTLSYSVTLSGGVQTVTQPIDLLPGPAARYVVTSSSPTATVGSTVTITAQLSDASGAPVSVGGRVVTWSRTGTGGSFASSTSTTNSAGVATVTFTIDTVAGTTAAIAATDNQSATGTTAVSSVAGSAVKLAFLVQPSSTGWRVRVSPAVMVAIQDQYSNIVTLSTQTIGLALASNPGGSTLAGGGAAAPSNGIVTFSNVVLDAEGTGYTLRATASSGALTAATSSAFSVTAVGVVTSTSETLVALAVDAGTVHYTSYRTDPLTNPPLSGRHSVPVTGGTAGVSNSQSFHLPGGGVISQGSIAAHVFLQGNNQRNGGIDGPLRIGFASVVSNILAGPGFLFDGTYFFTALSPYGAGTEAGGIIRARASDGQLKLLLYRRRQLPILPWTGGMAVAAGNVYYSDGSEIKRISVDSGPSTTLVTGVGTVSPSRRSMLVVGETLYWAEQGSGGSTSGSIRSSPISGGSSVLRVSGLSTEVNGMASDGTHLYVRDGGSLRRYRLTDFAAETIASDDNVADVALDSEAVYWISNGTTRTIKKRKK